MADFTQFANAFNQGLSAFTPPPEIFEPVNINQFKDQALEEVSPFFDKNLELAMKQLNQAKEQQKQAKELQERQEGESFGAFQGVQDRNFARVLARQQGGFAGRGTFNSGFRRGAIEDTRQGQEDVMSEAERQRRQSGETRNLGFEQFLQRSNLQEEQTKLQSEREKQEEAARRQQQLFTGEIAKRQSAQQQFENSFSRFLGEKLGG